MPNLLHNRKQWSQGTNPGIQWTLLFDNILLLILGGTMIVLGLWNVPQNRISDIDNHADLWWLGLMPLAIGLPGVVAAILSHQKLYMVWSVYSILLLTGSYIFYVKAGCFDPEAFGVTLRIFGICIQDKDTCSCIMSSEQIILSRAVCDGLRITTSIYMTQMVLMTLSVALVIIGCFLACLVSCCVKCHFPKKNDLQSSLQAKFSRPSSSGKRPFKTDYVQPSCSRSYVADTIVQTDTTVL